MLTEGHGRTSSTHAPPRRSRAGAAGAPAPAIDWDAGSHTARGRGPHASRCRTCRRHRSCALLANRDGRDRRVTWRPDGDRHGPRRRPRPPLLPRHRTTASRPIPGADRRGARSRLPPQLARSTRGARGTPRPRRDRPRPSARQRDDRRRSAVRVAPPRASHPLVRRESPRSQRSVESARNRLPAAGDQIDRPHASRRPAVRGDPWRGVPGARDRCLRCPDPPRAKMAGPSDPVGPSRSWGRGDPVATAAGRPIGPLRRRHWGPSRRYGSHHLARCRGIPALAPGRISGAGSARPSSGGPRLSSGGPRLRSPGPPDQVRRRSFVNSKPKRPLMQRWPSVTDESNGEVTFTIVLSWTWRSTAQPTPQ